MINSLKNIAVFSCTLTSRYRNTLCNALNTAAEKAGVNVVYFNFLGKIGNKNAEYGDYEYNILDYIDFDKFDGVIFDGEGFNVDGMADRVIEVLRGVKCPVVSISSYVEGFHNIAFDDADGICTLIEHFTEVHKLTRIGFMSGYLTHPDAQLRLKVFRETMKSKGLPEDGAGVFEGDFWFHKGEEAADYFLSQPQPPEAIVCANDYMAVSLCTALKKRGIKVPKDIAVSGFDGTEEAQEFIPHITSASRDWYDIASAALKWLLELCDGVETTDQLTLTPKPIYAQSCGCMKLNYREEAEKINNIYDFSRKLSYNLYDAESAMLKLNAVNSIKKLEEVFDECACNFGDLKSFCLMTLIDSEGRPAYDSDYTSSSGRFIPSMWIDRGGDKVRPEGIVHHGELIPHSNSEKPQFYYVMNVHCSERAFGYSVIEMDGKGIFNDFFYVWLLNIAMTFESFLKNDRISKLIATLEDLSIRDGLTGMLNRRGFDELSREAIKSFEEPRAVCTMVIDMDGLKHINDEFGHHEGDRAIKALANIITKCCDSGEIAGRAGGDEFYIFASEYTEKKLERFVSRMRSLVDSYNETYHRSFKLDFSYGSCLTETDSSCRIEDLLKESDSRMYDQKQAKPNRRK